MARRLPSLSGLRAFEAAARHLSFTDAAGELNVTQAAISHRVRDLEADLGVRLFDRGGRRVSLTADGNRLADTARSAFDMLATTVERLRWGGDGMLTVSVTHAFSTRWLVRRLGRFWDSRPEIDLRLHHSMSLVDFDHEPIDMAIRFGGGSWRGLKSIPLMGTDLIPVCSPALMKARGPIAGPSDLVRFTLLHEDDYTTWEEWSNAVGVHDLNVRRGPVFDDLSVLYAAATSGQGVALARCTMVTDELESGRLVSPLPLNLSSRAGFFIVHPPGAEKRSEVAAFRDFLLEEVARELAPNPPSSDEPSDCV